MSDMGEMPPATQPSARAFWVAGVINPLPPLGIALEIRPAVLASATAELRLQVAEVALRDSIERLRESSGYQRFWVDAGD